jgi:RNA polymerase sigma-70 factor (ECF subfamily)
MRIEPAQQAREAGWARQAASGDEQAFARLVEAFQVPVYNLCYRMLGDHHEAEDAAQETFLKAYRGIRAYDPERSFSSWCLSVAAHECIDRLRRRRMSFVGLDELEGSADLADPAPGPEAAAARSEHERRVARLLTKLGPQDRAVVTLKYWYDMPLDEIAGVLDLSTSAVKSRLHRARREMAENWQQQAQGAGVPKGGRSDVPLPV